MMMMMMMKCTDTGCCEELIKHTLAKQIWPSSRHGTAHVFKIQLS